jgi:tetratricopeptide (TPR) repeat protein
MGTVTLTVKQAFDRAVAAYNAGKFNETEALCQQILKAKDDFFEAVFLLASVQSRLRKNQLALANYHRAVSLRPDQPEPLNAFGNELFQLGRHSEALVNFDRALEIRPNYADALNNRANTLKALKRFEEALATYDRAIAVQPDFAVALCNRGITLKELRQFDNALASYDRALAIKPDYAEALNYRGNALRELKRLPEALASYQRAIALRPDYTDALNNCANALKGLKRFSDALAYYNRVLELRPNHAETLNNRGNALRELKRFDEALANYDRALAARPDYADALNNRGIALQWLNRFDEALSSYNRAAELWPNYAEALNNRGNALQQLQRFDEALASYDRAIAVRPEFAEFHYNKALCMLLVGDLDRGWQEHEWRWQCQWLRKSKRAFAQPLWTGAESIAGKTVLLHAEQSFGDTIQFCRYAPLIEDRGARVVLEVPRPLHRLMTTLTGTTQIIPRGDAPPEFDFHCPLMSLPLACGTRLETIPSITPYLRADPAAASVWSKKIGRKRRPWIGLAWSGRPTHVNDHNRSMSLRSLLPLLETDATFISLQKDIRADDVAILKDQKGLIDLTDALEDFSDTAALISKLDLVISVDTSIAHLAGALAKSVWVLMPFLPDWRWQLNRDDSPWYPTARLFRQDQTRTWDAVVARVRVALSKFV